MTPQDKVLVSAAEAAAMLSIGRSTFFQKVADGVLPQPVRFGGITRWRVDDLRAVGQANPPTTSSGRAADPGTAPGCTRP